MKKAWRTQHWQLALIGTLCIFSSCSSTSPVSPSPNAHRMMCVRPNTTQAFVPPPETTNAGDYERISPRAARNLVKLKGHVPVQIGQSKQLERVSADETLTFSVGLELNNRSELHQEIQAIYDSNSSRFQQFLSSEEFKEKYGATYEQFQNAFQILIVGGLDILDQTGNLLKVAGRVSDIEALFHTELYEYEGPDSRTFFAPAYELQLPAGSSISGVFGLNNYARAHHHLKAHATIEPRLSGFAYGYFPSDIRKAYNIPSSLTGAGQKVALVQLDGFTMSDIIDYQKCYSCTNSNRTVPSTAPAGSPSVPLSIRPVPTSSPPPAAGVNSDEVTLDIEMLIAMAPGLAQIQVYEGVRNSFSVLQQVYNQINADNANTPIIISTSWGIPENELTSSELNSEYDIFAAMASQGQTLFAASGDNGAYDDGVSLSVDDPASQPFVLGVGGTSLLVNSDSTYRSETAWAGGGGGVSSVWTMPVWQQNLIQEADTDASPEACSMRNVPDVSLHSDPFGAPGYAIRYRSQWAIYGGTSAAAPLWAAFAALANQKRASLSLPPLGFMPPTLYAIAATSSYSTSFHDIADGSSNGHFLSVPGYDNTTGLGSINGTNLIQTLSNSIYPVLLPSSTFR